MVGLLTAEAKAEDKMELTLGGKLEPTKHSCSGVTDLENKSMREIDSRSRRYGHSLGAPGGAEHRASRVINDYTSVLHTDTVIYFNLNCFLSLLTAGLTKTHV